jgi:L-fucose isomerase-like protein
VETGKPIVLVDYLYSGTPTFIFTYRDCEKEGRPVVGVASSDFCDVAKAARLFEVVKAIQSAKVVDVMDRDISEHADLIKKATGIEVLPVGLAELNSCCEKADEKEAAKWADKWARGAEKVVEPTREDLIKSGKMHLANSTLMTERGAEAIAIDCLGGFYSRKLSAYPCLSFVELNSGDLEGACEADLNSTTAMIMMRHLTGRAGFISDPVFDLPKSQIIYSHCVAPMRVFGSREKSNPYIIRSHSEDRKGASVQALLPLGETVTSIQTNAKEKALVLHSGKTVANIDDDKACRTKLATEANVEKILETYRWGWHRVTFFGNWRKDVKDLATLMGLHVYEEDV